MQICTVASRSGVGAGPVLHLAASSGPSLRGLIVRVLAVVLAAATLGACAGPSVFSSRPTYHRTAYHYHFRRHYALRETGGGGPSNGVASFYSSGLRTANGERFNPQELTAAHRTLPFGTRLRVTDVSSGRSVTVRVNDRGPFVRGRVIDVSRSAAQQLGMVNRGVAKVKIDVVK